MIEPAEETPVSEEELEALLFRYRHDYTFFAPKVLKVLAIEGEVKPFVFNGPQLILHEIVSRVEASDRLVRLVALKARRMGFSTYFSGRYYHRTSWNFNRLASQITHEPEATDTLFKMVKRFYNLTPEMIRPTTRYNNTKLLEFNNKEDTGLGSGFRVATAAKDDFGSGQLIHYLHGSELAKWPAENIESLLTSVLQCVPRQKGTEVVFESTAKGIGGEFYDRFWGARYRFFIRKLDPEITAKADRMQEFLTKEQIVAAAEIKEEVNESAPVENQTTSIFLPWFCFEEYQMKPPPGFEVQENPNDPRRCEKTLKERFNLTDAQIYWWRFVLHNDEIRGSIEKMMQEYPSTPEEAFIATGRPVFDNLKLMAMKDAVKPPIARYECQTGLMQFLSKADGRLKVWEEPKPGRSYVIGADVAEGLEKGDFSVADVIDHRTGEQVAQWHGHIKPDLFAMLLQALGKRYNEALIAPERNNHGLMVVICLVNAEYPNVYAEMVPEPPGKPRKRYGWVTSSATKPLIIDHLDAEVREGTSGIQCAETLDEMMSFKIQENGKMEADSNRFDDRVMSYAIAKHVRNVTPLPKPGLPAHIKRQLKRAGRKKPSAKGWT